MNQLTRAFNDVGLGTAFATFTRNQYLTTGKRISQVFNQTFQPNQEELNFLESYNLDLVKVASQRELTKIKQVLEVGLINNQSSTTVKQALDQIRKTAINHTQTLVRTELNRANNMGSLNAMKQAGVKTKKYLLMVDDNRTSGISKALHKKYGTEEQAIDLDKEFKAVFQGKTYSGLAPPFHPNDRDVVIYTL